MTLKKMIVTMLVSLMGMPAFVSAQQQSAIWRDWLDKKQYEKVVADTLSLHPIDTADFLKMYLLGQAYEGLLRYKKAYACYRHCYVVDSMRTDMLNTLARISVQLGKGKEAEMYYKRVLQQDSTDFYANYQLARLYVQMDNPNAAMSYYDYLLDKDPENAVILQAKGDCYTRIDSLMAAKGCYLEAFELNMENASLASTLINVLLTLYDPIENDFLTTAQLVCDTALFYHPQNRSLRQKKAMIYYRQKEYLQANHEYTALLADMDSSYMTLKYGGCARFHAGQWFDAIELLEKAYKQDTTAYDVCLLLGISVGRTYDTNAAFQYFKYAEEAMQPDSYWMEMLVQFRAEMYLKRGECEKGSQMYYELWKSGKKQLVWLQQIQFCYGRKPLADMSDEERQRALFIYFLNATELLEKPFAEGRLMQYSYLVSRLKKYDEEMFFRDMDHLPMVAPDGKKNTISKEKIRETIRKLSEKTEKRE